MDEQMTRAEQNLLLLEAAIPANEKFYIWCYEENGEPVASSCPKEMQEILERAFRLFGGVEKALAHTASLEGKPLLVGSPIGMQWAVTFETERKQSLCFVMGPVFYGTPVEAQIREALRPYRDGLENSQWAGRLLRRLGELPVMPYAIFSRYVIMVHNLLTGQQLDVSALYETVSAPTGSAVAPPQKRDRTKVYLAEQALLEMVRKGDINYHDVLNHSSSLSPGVPVQGREPLQQERLSIVVFTSLVCRAAMEGGLSPEIAYALGDSYIEAAVNSNDSGELNELALTMYHDFIYRVHHLHIDPACSPAIQKCCDYIELNLDKKIRISDLAALTGYTEYYLTEKFKKETGMPLFLYIRRTKLERARVLLESSDLSVARIADALAFTTQNYFIRCFREDMGCSPAQYRKRSRNPVS